MPTGSDGCSLSDIRQKPVRQAASGPNSGRSEQPFLEILPWEHGGGVSIVGELDISTVEDFRATLDALPAQQTGVFDLAELSFVDVVGLHAVEDHARMLNGAGPLVLENVSARIRRLFEIVGAGQDSRLEFRS